MTTSPCAVVDDAKTGIRPFVIATLHEKSWRMVITIHDADDGIVLKMPLGATNMEIEQFLITLAAGKRPIRRRNWYHIGTEGEAILQAMRENGGQQSIVIDDVIREVSRLQSSRWIRDAATFLATWWPEDQQPTRRP